MIAEKADIIAENTPLEPLELPFYRHDPKPERKMIQGQLYINGQRRD